MPVVSIQSNALQIAAQHIKRSVNFNWQEDVQIGYMQSLVKANRREVRVLYDPHHAALVAEITGHPKGTSPAKPLKTFVDRRNRLDKTDTFEALLYFLNDQEQHSIGKAFHGLHTSLVLLNIGSPFEAFPFS
eukprot:CAMPEP_0184676240 /NCGR_PEP_ID=MMETSP0308-20130426/88245_1 /TAXON_ID=38269 /ORGANISM="Gloeochaete witrockiana, Strain SAG 46.84" /LENGTH=131 /DNA_ID=CAMNT_0027124057 /DNA_START=600 /DNA_END=995 /DNA_ORIENTATION=-